MMQNFNIESRDYLISKSENPIYTFMKIPQVGKPGICGLFVKGYTVVAALGSLQSSFQL